MHVVEVFESHMAYTEEGKGDRAVVFLHGNPTSSYLWRNVIPHVADRVRCLAPDLIGMGASGKPDIAYRFADHARYLDAWFDALNVGEVVLVGHDWGGALGLDWAAHHPERVRGVALLETFLRPMTWAEYPPEAAPLFQSLRTPGTGEKMVLEKNWFIETALRATNPQITDDDLAAYRAPYLEPASRRPLLQWAREIPIDDDPADVRDRFIAYDRWLADTPDVPKLLLTVEPGDRSLVSPAIVQWCRANIAGLEVENVGQAGHHAPEDQPDAIGQVIARWLAQHRLTDS